MSFLLPICAVTLALQQPAPADRMTASQPTLPAADLPADGRELLAAVRDNVFSFDDPAFYWFCRFVRTDDGRRRLSATGSDASVPLKFLLERPGDYRGRVVDVDGAVQAVHRYDITNRADVGPVTQYELSEPGTRAICTFVCVGEAREVAVGQRIRTRGFFIKNRAYQTTGREAGAGPLVVGLDVVVLGDGVRRPRSHSSDSAIGWLSGLVGAMAVIWVILRRRHRRAGPAVLRRSSAGGHEAESEADFAWLREKAPGGEESGR